MIIIGVIIGFMGGAALLGAMLLEIAKEADRERLRNVNRELEQAFGLREGAGDPEEEITQVYRG